MPRQGSMISALAISPGKPPTQRDQENPNSVRKAGQRGRSCCYQEKLNELHLHWHCMNWTDHLTRLRHVQLEKSKALVGGGASLPHRGGNRNANQAASWGMDE